MIIPAGLRVPTIQRRCHSRVYLDDVRTYRPGRTTLVLAGVACVFAVVGIALNYFGGGRVLFSHCLLALGLLAFIVWFSGRTGPDG